jgi:hypothetical protein
MKRQTITRFMRLFVYAAVCLSATTSWARPPRAREACGAFQVIDRQSHLLTLLPTKSKKPLVMLWTVDTRFVRDWQFKTADSLKEGTQACVYYRSPFFGKPFVAKVIWTNGKEPHNAM